jgi:hypothetical protein
MPDDSGSQISLDDVDWVQLSPVLGQAALKEDPDPAKPRGVVYE